MAGIVVGFDGSSCSQAALRWAFTEAELRHSAVTLVSVVEQYRLPSTWMSAVYVEREEDLAHARRLASDALEKLAAERGSGKGIDCDVHIVSGNAPKLLVEASQDAELLVLGSRGHGPIDRMLLGSVSTYAVHHARCPVTVVRS